MAIKSNTTTIALRMLRFGMLISLAFAHPQSPFADDSKIDGLKTPDSPVLSLLGKASPSIQRPTDPKAAAVLLANSLVASNGLVPGNFGMEIAPYWLAPKKDLTFSQYQNANAIQTIKQTFAVSLVTSEQLPDSVLTIMKGGVIAGAGIRFSVFKGRYAEFEHAKTQLALVQNRILDEVKKQDGGSRDSMTLFIQKAAKLNEEIGTLGGAVGRKGINIDFGMAATFLLPNGGMDSSELYKIGIWPSFSYVMPHLESIVMLRYFYNARLDTAHAFDGGIRLVGKYEGAAFSLEALLRVDGKEKWNFSDESRIVGGIEYEITKGTFVSVGLGQDFKERDSRRLIALAGLSIGFGPDPVLKPDPK